MKMTSEGKHLLLTDLRRRMQQRDWNISKLAKESGINQSHVSRIAAGHFKTFSSNIMKICITLDMESSSYRSTTRADEDRQQIASTAISIWNGTHSDAATVVSLLREIAKLRKHRSRR